MFKSFGHWNSLIGYYLACLREAASAKAGICNLGFGYFGNASG
jgi:membrane protein DedA with SNARE-associated domain